ncbi:MAG: AtpZ/AtpI family protein [Candidatus Cohnella colombiensis]|uniref:AtpZ/AtpI family protein n=1 Tax=Candidatus Cohnella colombiensis TaxID=3121368 RepID=A0AA95EW52_9BACL|nr:MAG: AtpZ/AtpI family protein [Cohnella sp.]
MTESTRKPELPPDENPWKAAGLVAGLGIELAVCIGLGWWLGSIYDNRNGTDYGYITGVVIGLVSGIGSAVALIRKYTGASKP